MADCVYRSHNGDCAGDHNGRSLVLTVSLENITFFLYLF